MSNSFLAKILKMRTVLVLNVVLLFFLSVDVARTFLRNAAVQKEIEVYEDETSDLQETNAALLELMERLQTKFFVEKEGRKKYGLQQEGERLVIVSPSSPNSTPAEAALDESEETDQSLIGEVRSLSPAKRWWYFFFNRTAYRELSGS